MNLDKCEKKNERPVKDWNEGVKEAMERREVANDD